MTYLSLGTNLGDREQNLCRAIQLIEKRIGHITAQSAFIATAPWGFESENEFLNACVGVETTLTPRQLLSATRQIERQMGRTQKSSGGAYHDRIIDIDILLVDQLQVCQSDLCIPHPHMSQRLFVLRPLAEIAYNVSVPGSSMSVGEMLSALEASA